MGFIFGGERAHSDFGVGRVIRSGWDYLGLSGLKISDRILQEQFWVEVVPALYSSLVKPGLSGKSRHCMSSASSFYELEKKPIMCLCKNIS